MGGGPLGKAVEEHLAAGLAVTAEPGPAATLNDDLERVREMGVKVGEPPRAGAAQIFCSDLELALLRQTLAAYEAPWPRAVAAAVCDHGHSPGYSNRKFRFGVWRRFLEAGGGLELLATQSPPPEMTRLAALAEQAPGAWVMDTAAAALWGALEDPAVARLAGKGLVVVNLGNMHTVGFLLHGRRCLGVYEHHTGCLDAPRLAEQLARFAAGELSDQEVFDDQGHGAARLAGAPAGELPIVVTGPRRALVEGLGWQVAAPYGDVMLSGCFGLVAAARAAGA
jgi:uncharacterized protein (DUF1786 family)